MNSRRLGAIVGGVVVLSGFAACGDADHVYVADEDTGVFLQLPKDWTVFEVEDGDANVNPRTNASSGEWAVIIDGSDDPRRSHLEDIEPVAHIGRASVLNITTASIPRTHTALRTLLTPDGSDPLEQPSDGLQIDSYDELELGNAWGYRMVFTQTLAPGVESSFIQLAFFDDGGNRLMMLSLGCSVACYEERGDEIEAIADTFTIEGPA